MGVRKDRLDHAVEVIVDVVIPEAKRQETEPSKMCVAARVMREASIFAMLAAVDIDDEPRLEADEVENVAFQRRLSPEVKALWA